MVKMVNLVLYVFYNDKKIEDVYERMLAPS